MTFQLKCEYCGGLKPEVLAEARASRATPSPSLAAREAAEEIAALEKPNHSNGFIEAAQCDICTAYRQRIVAIIERHCSPVPAAGDDEDEEPNPLLPIVAKAAKEPCRHYAQGCPVNEPDESFWCAPCSARESIDAIRGGAASAESVGEEEK